MRVVALVAVVVAVLLFVPGRPVDRLRTVARGRAHLRWPVIRRQRVDLVPLLSAFAAELRAGSTVQTAMREAFASRPDVCPATAAALARGDDVSLALRADADQSGQPALASLAASVALAQKYGVALARTADELVEHSRAAVETQRLLEAELAEARATVRVLAALPLAGIALGALLGANPVVWLFGSLIGVAVLCAALLFEGVGLLWVRAIVLAVRRRL